MQLLSRHSQLEQSGTKAQLSLITILSLTQITELKLLLDIGRHGNRFYDMILAMLVVSICLEVFIGVIVIYIGNLHYYQPSDGSTGVLRRMFHCLFRCHRRGGGGGGGTITTSPTTMTTLSTTSKTYQSLAGGGGGGARRSGRTQRGLISRQVDAGLLGAGSDQRMATEVLPEDQTMTTMFQPSSAFECLVELDRADFSAKDARMRSADACLSISTAAGYVKAVEEATKRCPGSSELREELARAQRALGAALQDKASAEADERLHEAQLNRAFCLKEIFEDQQEKKTFRKLSFWQHLATYLLYFVMLLNIFIATFGISSGAVVVNDEGGFTPTPGGSLSPMYYTAAAAQVKENLTAGQMN